MEPSASPIPGMTGSRRVRCFESSGCAGTTGTDGQAAESVDDAEEEEPNLTLSFLYARGMATASPGLYDGSAHHGSATVREEKQVLQVNVREREKRCTPGR